MYWKLFVFANKLPRVLAGKLLAAWTLFTMIRFLSNWNLVWSAYRRAKPLPVFEFRNGIKMHHGPKDDPVGLLIEIFGEQVYRSKSMTQSTGVLIDIGANIGANVLLCSLKNPNLRIEAYEPNPQAFKSLQMNIAENHLGSRVVAYNEAVGEKPGLLRLFVGEWSLVSSAFTQEIASHQNNFVIAPMVSLDQVLARVKGEKIQFLKIDAEGSEESILRGASRDSMKLIPSLVIETHNIFVPDIDQNCQNLLVAHGFKTSHSLNTGTTAILWGYRNTD